MAKYVFKRSVIRSDIKATLEQLYDLKVALEDIIECLECTEVDLVNVVEPVSYPESKW